MKHKQEEKVTLYLKEVMKRKNISNVWLAKNLGYSNEAVSRMVCGYATPSVATLKKISELLCVSVVELLYGYNENNQHNEMYVVKGSYYAETLDLFLELREKMSDRVVFMARSWDAMKVFCFENGITKSQIEIEK